MKPDREKLEQIVGQIEVLLEKTKALEKTYAAQLEKVHPNYRKSALNLVHYRALRSQDIRELQKKLRNLGLTRLARAESHVVASLQSLRSILQAMMEPKPVRFKKAPVSIKKGEKLLQKNTNALLGRRKKSKRVRIMVTLPGESVQNGKLVPSLVAAGMDAARINCAHDNATVWKQLIDQVRESSRKAQRNVRISVDLGGPKIRTGIMRPGPKVASFAPERNNLGFVISPAVVWFAPPEVPAPVEGELHLPVSPQWCERVEEGDVIFFEDTRGKERRLQVNKVLDGGFWAGGYDRSFVTTGTPLFIDGKDIQKEPIGELPPAEEYILLNTGDRLILHREPIPGEPAEYDQDGNLLREAHISCTNEKIFEQLRPGKRILFDDGKIEGVVENVEPGEQIDVRITYAKEGGQKLRADKGINLPDSNLSIQGLTRKDREDLSFLAEHVDIVNMSFVNTTSDVRDLLDEMEQLGVRDRLGVILKIETQQGYDHLTEILLAAMETFPIGVMIARGDLAIECGWENMPRIQEEILSICMAAHVPDIWATQVLENMAKKGLPSRAEVTDAAMAQRAECVMLNKGPYIVRTIQMLNDILEDMKDYQIKKLPMLPALNVPLAVEAGREDVSVPA